MALELDPEKWANFMYQFKRKKTVSVDVNWCQGETARAVDVK